MTAGIIVALRQEQQSIYRRRLRRGIPERLPSGDWICLSGAGAAPARRAASLLLEKGAGHLISWGTATALTSGLLPGMLLLPSVVLDRNGHQFIAAKEWLEEHTGGLPPSLEISAALHFGAAPLLKTPGEKQHLFETTGAVSADMESAAIAAVADLHHVPFTVIRAIADDAKTVLPEIIVKAIDGDGALRLGWLFTGLIRHPGTLPLLLILRRHLQRADRTLSAAAAVLISASKKSI